MDFIGKKILIVEDDLEIASLIKDYLIREGFIIRIAPDGLTGLKLTKSFQPDLIILDIISKMNSIKIILDNNNKCDIIRIVTKVWQSRYYALSA